MFYHLMRSLLFKLDAEKAHNMGLKGMNILETTGLSSLLYPATPATLVHITG